MTMTTTTNLWGVFLANGTQICLPANGKPGLASPETAARLADTFAAPTYIAIVGQEENA